MYVSAKTKKNLFYIGRLFILYRSFSIFFLFFFFLVKWTFIMPLRHKICFARYMPKRRIMAVWLKLTWHTYAMLYNTITMMTIKEMHMLKEMHFWKNENKTEIMLQYLPFCRRKMFHFMFVQIKKSFFMAMWNDESALFDVLALKEIDSLNKHKNPTF